MVYESAFAQPADLGRLRAGTIAALEEQGRTRDHVRIVGLLLSELATNALMHASSPFLLTVEMDEDETFLEVTDAGDGDAFARAPAHVDGGYGLNLVNALASSWGATPRAHGKTVWAVIGRDLTF
jgi:anti-sigma regulatory factor (Ser/Thr protein kinase)